MSNTESIIDKIPELKKNITSIFLTTNENISSRLINNLNNNLSEIINNKNNSTKVIELSKDGKIIIDGNKLSEIWDKTYTIIT